MIALTHAMVLAAGLGQRMRPLTETTAKPLLMLQDRSLLDRALDRLAAAGVEDVVVNAHWHADQVAAAVAARAAPRIALQREAVLLETGGGVALARPRLGDGPFAVVNGDSVWLDGPTPARDRMRAACGGRRNASSRLTSSPACRSWRRRWCATCRRGRSA